MPVSDPITDCTFDRLAILNRESLNRPQIAGEVLSYGFEGPQNFLRSFRNFLGCQIEYRPTVSDVIHKAQSYPIISLRIMIAIIIKHDSHTRSVYRAQIAGEVLSSGFEEPQNFLRSFMNFLGGQIEDPQPYRM